MSFMNREKIVEEIRSRKGIPIRMKAASLKGFDFSGMDLADADLSFSNLSEANFNGANLHNARLQASNLARASFRNADLTNADFSYSNLNDSDMTGAKMEGINLSFSSKGTAFRWSDLNLVALIQSQSWVGMVVAMLIGAIFVYGVSGIIYFTNQMTTASDPLVMKLNQYVVVNNILSGILTVLFTFALAPMLDRYGGKIWVRHLVISILITVGYLAFATVLYYAWGRGFFADLARQAAETGNTQSLSAPWYLYTLGPLIVANLFYYLNRQGRQLTRKISEQEYELLALEKLKTRAELSALQARINPHFLYNSLNSIASLVHEDPDKAEQMTILLSRLFRYTTSRSNDDYFDTIANELEMVRTYLQVEQVRFGDRLQFEVQVDAPELQQLTIPKFLLQPIVENAVKHGISKLPDQGCIRVRIYGEQGWLYLCVYDNGPAFEENLSAGYGIRSIQEKLKLLYQEEAAVELRNAPAKHVCVRVRKDLLARKEFDQESGPSPAATPPI
jgi:two-component system, LytTR family, sensor kinase